VRLTNWNTHTHQPPLNPFSPASMHTPKYRSLRTGVLLRVHCCIAAAHDDDQK
jgi:hypothetical protein